MEPTLRGAIEKRIDDILMSKALNNIIEVIREFKPYVKNEEDAALGFILGSIGVRLAAHTLIINKREATIEEHKELFEILARRTPEIKSKILQALT